MASIPAEAVLYVASIHVLHAASILAFVLHLSRHERCRMWRLSRQERCRMWRLSRPERCCMWRLSRDERCCMWRLSRDERCRVALISARAVLPVASIHVLHAACILA